MAHSSPAQTERSLYGDPEGFRDIMRELIYGAPNHKSIAIELFGAEKVGNSYSRLAHALQPKEPGVPSNNFDVDWVMVVARELSPASRMRLAWCREETIEERLARLEEKQERTAQEQIDELRELRALREEAAASAKKNGRGPR